jgi:hypothetical protein
MEVLVNSTTAQIQGSTNNPWSAFPLRTVQNRDSLSERLNAISHVFVVYQAGYLRFFAMLQEITRSL